MREDVGIVVRAAGERTLGMCVELARPQGAYVEVINERPFHRALVRGFELGIEHNLPWTLCLDADILLMPNAVVRMKAVAERDPAASGCGGWMLDKFYGDLKVRGAHLYRTAFLARSLEFARELGEVHRPETGVHEAMGAQGCAWLLSDGAVGLHGYGQYYRDIFRTNAVRAIKSSVDDRQLQRRTALHRRIDSDFAVMAEALAAGTQDQRVFSLDRDHWKERTQHALAALGLEEKELPTSAAGNATRLLLKGLEWVPASVLKRLIKRNLGFQQRLTKALNRE